MKYFTKEVQIGLTAVVAIVVLFFGDFVNLGAADYRMKPPMVFYGIATFVVRVIVPGAFYEDISFVIDAH